jgi:hypothetical protein
MLLNKAETLPDFLVAFDYIYVEGKGGTDSWNFKTSITPTQDRVCLEHESWLFLELGPGRAPAGRKAWLMPWITWKHMQQKYEKDGFSSIIFGRTVKSRNPVAQEDLKEWELVWADGGWKIPERHSFWYEHPNYHEEYWREEDK